MGILAINIKVLRTQAINWTGECPFSIYREGDIHFIVTARRERGRAATVLHPGALADQPGAVAKDMWLPSDA